MAAGDLNEQDIINKIRANKVPNIPLFGKNFLNNIHNKVLNKVQGRSEYQEPESSEPRFANKADAVIHADMNFRKDVTDLAESLIDLGDREIAKKLLTEHINMLKEILKQFKEN
jgi:Tfp pilus assembly protein FimV